VLPITSFTHFCWSFLFIGLVYYTTYFTVGSLLFLTNPIPRTPQRMANVTKELKLGISALFFVIVYTVGWLWLVDPKTPWYGYWEGRENQFTPFEAMKQPLIYLLTFDAWFYATHHFLHLNWFMTHIHRYHHVPMSSLSNFTNHRHLPKTQCIPSRRSCRVRWVTFSSPSSTP
jgi:lathosterol oxidase